MNREEDAEEGVWYNALQYVPQEDESAISCSDSVLIRFAYDGNDWYDIAYYSYAHECWVSETAELYGVDDPTVNGVMFWLYPPTDEYEDEDEWVRVR